jgi:hypothetical protein
MIKHFDKSTSQCETPTTNAAEGKITERRYGQILPSEMTLTSAKHQKYRADRVLSTHSLLRTRNLLNDNSSPTLIPFFSILLV